MSHYLNHPSGAKAQGSKYYYTDKLFGQHFSFTLKTDEVMVKFAPKPKGLQKATAQAVVEQTSLETIHDVVEAHRFCISSIPAGSAIETVISKLETNASVQAAFPARVDQAGNTRYFILDEFTVPFKENMSIRKRCSQIVKSHNCEVVKDHLTPGYYTLSVPSCNGMFEMVVFS